MDDSNKTAFDKLVAGLSAEERTDMLSRLNVPNAKDVEFSDSPKQIDDFQGTLTARLKKESLLYRIVLWLRAVFSKTTVQKLYNYDVLNSLAKKINREHPGLLDMRNHYLDNLFYEQLTELKDAADFFKPYFFKIDDDPGAFYVFLSSFIAPQIGEEINSKVDPFSLSLPDEPMNDVRNSLLKSLDEIMKDISGPVKNTMYNGVKSVHWLRSFVNLPYLHFLAQFTDIKTDVFTCSFLNAKIDYESFAAVFDKEIVVPNEVLEAIFLFAQKPDLADRYSEGDIEQATKNFLSEATNHFSVIKLFLSIVPIDTLGKIIFSDYDWTPTQIGGGEDWFSKFKTQWRKIFDIRWADFVRNKKKEVLAANMKTDFELLSFPESPMDLWKSVWGGTPIKYEMTSAFLSWYCTEEYPEAKKILTALLMEGIFLKNENRTEFSEALDLLDSAASDMCIFLEKMDYDGEYGAVFNEAMDHSVRSVNLKSNLENLIYKIEKDMKSISERICKSIRTIEIILKGIFGETNDGYHATIQNLHILKGRNTAKLKDELMQTRKDLNQVLYYLSEFEPIDVLD